MLAMISPVFYVMIFLWVLHKPLVTLIVFELTTMIIFPTVYIKYVNQQKHPYKLIYYLSKHYQIWLQILIGLVAAITVAFSIICALYFVMIETALIDFDALGSLKQTDAEVYITCFLLGLVNPFLEEFFWRGFMPISLMGGISEQSRYQEKLILFINFFYTIYHLPVVMFFVYDVYPAFVVIFFLFFGGRIFVLQNDKIGYICSSLTHLGADMAIVSLILYYNIKK